MPANYVLLDRIELNASAASVVFDNIPQTGYTDLKIVISARSTATPGVPDDGLFLQVNAITSGYSNRTVYGTGASALSASNSYGVTSKTYISAVDTSNATANTFNNVEVYIPNYAGSTNKSMSIDGVIENNATSSILNLTAALLSNTAAISSLTLTPNTGSFVQYSTFSLYGIAALGTTPAIAPKANGGNVIGTDGTYWYHAFLSSGTFTPQVALNADVLVVAGGGGGGGSYAGGGGAGGLLAFTGQSLANATSYACTIGSGGSGGAQNVSGTTGSDSQFAALTLVKGGGGAGNGGAVTTNVGLNGGSGGGAGRNAFAGGDVAGGTATSGQGFAGGSYVNATAGNVGAGGGGAGAIGGSQTSAGNVAGVGGAGTNSYSSWLSATGLGVSGFIAGGGGGGAFTGASAAGTGGAGGGANGGYGVSGSSASVNTGGGGGGGGGNTSYAGGNGGSGVVIIRYLVA